MKRHRYKVSFFLTTLLYASAIGLYLYTFKTIVAIAEKPDESKMVLALSQFVPKTTPSDVAAPVQQEHLVKEKPIEEPAEEPKPPKPDIPPVQEKPKPLKTPVVKPEPKPVVKKTPKNIAKPKLKKHKKVKKHTRQKHRKRQVSGGGSPHRSAARKNVFLAQIRAKINRAKSYPRMAKRRGMQGTVKARFTILKNGHIGNIVLSGSSLFFSSARKAIKSAFPVNANKAPMPLPSTVSLTLRYRLR